MGESRTATTRHAGPGSDPPSNAMSRRTNRHTDGSGPEAPRLRNPHGRRRSRLWPTYQRGPLSTTPPSSNSAIQVSSGAREPPSGKRSSSVTICPSFDSQRPVPPPSPLSCPQTSRAGGRTTRCVNVGRGQHDEAPASVCPASDCPASDCPASPAPPSNEPLSPAPPASTPASSGPPASRPESGMAVADVPASAGGTAASGRSSTTGSKQAEHARRSIVSRRADTARSLPEVVQSRTGPRMGCCARGPVSPQSPRDG